LKTVLITGVAGFLGSHLADKFLEEGWQVRGVDNLLGGEMANVPDGVDFYKLDLGSDQVIGHSAFQGVELVVHAGAVATEGLSVFSPALVTYHNTQATVNTVTAAANAGAKRFVYTSSMARYGNYGSTLYTEDLETRPEDPYGIAKVASENLVKNICETHGMIWTIIVPHNIIGSRQKYNDPFRNVAGIFANRMLQGKQPIIYGDGKQRRSFTFIEDVVQPMFLATQKFEAAGQVINVGPDNESTTIIELAEKVAAILDFSLEPIYMPDRPREVKIALCSADKAKRILDYQAKTSVDDGLRELVDWIKSEGPRPFDYNLPIEINSPAVPKSWSQKLL
jgi:UDP-glucose 4-epimerase